MTTAYTSLLGLALPVTGELSGTWGDTVNNSITSLLDSAVAGTTTLSTDADVTLTTTTGSANQAREAILLCSGSRTALRTITAPAQSKIYTIINATTGGYSVKVVGVGPTTGVTIAANESAIVAWNGSDFIKIASTVGVSSITFGSTGLTPSTATSGAVTVAGTLANTNGGTGQSSAFTQYGITYASTTTALATTAAGTSTTVLHGNASGTPTFGAVSLTADVSGTLPVANGGTGVTTSTGSGNNVLSTSPTLVTPVLGTPTSGTLSNCTVDGTNSVGYLNIPQNSQSAAYTLVLSDAGKSIYHPSADTTARTWTIPANSSVAFPIGTAVTFINDTSGGSITIAITTDTLVLAGAGTTGSRTLAANGMATAIKMTSTRWMINGAGLT